MTFGPGRLQAGSRAAVRITSPRPQLYQQNARINGAALRTARGTDGLHPRRARPIPAKVPAVQTQPRLDDTGRGQLGVWIRMRDRRVRHAVLQMQVFSDERAAGRSATAIVGEWRRQGPHNWRGSPQNSWHSGASPTSAQGLPCRRGAPAGLVIRGFDYSACQIAGTSSRFEALNRKWAATTVSRPPRRA